MVEYEYDRLHEQIFRRIGGVVDLPRLAASRVLVIGAGAVGSWITFFLSLSGVGTGRGGLFVIDPDEIEIENVSRHSVGLPYVDSEVSNKAEAVANVIHYRLPVTNILSSDQNFLNITDESQEELFRWADLVISAAGHPDVDYRVQQLAFQAQKPAMFPLILSDANLSPGELAWLIYYLPEPNRTPCLACLTRNRQAQAVEGESTLGIDVIYFASVCTSYALAILLGETSTRARILNRNRNLVLVHNAAPRSASLEGIINSPFEVKDVRTRRLANCTICGENRPSATRPRTNAATAILTLITAATILHGGLQNWIGAEVKDFVQSYSIEAPQAPSSANPPAIAPPTADQNFSDSQNPEIETSVEIRTIPEVEESPTQAAPVQKPEAQPVPACEVYQMQSPAPAEQEPCNETEIIEEVIEVIEIVEVDECDSYYESWATEEGPEQPVQEIATSVAEAEQSSAATSVQSREAETYVYYQTQCQSYSGP